MRKYTYKVYFDTGFTRIVEAMCEQHAKILAQAMEIHAARDYQVSEIKKLKD